jgi:hypothetical protein
MSDFIIPKQKSLLSVPFSGSRPLSDIQAQVDALVSHSMDEATNWKTISAMTAAGAASRLLRLGSMTAAAPLLAHRSAWLPALIRTGSQAVALSGESAVFAGMSRSFRNLEGRPSSQPFSEEWAQTMISLGSLKAFGGITKGQNIVLQHLAADLGLVAGQNLASAAHLTGKSSGGLIEQMLGAEALNWQMKAGMGLVHGLTPQLMALEKSADLSLESQEREIRLKNPPLLSFLSRGLLPVLEGGFQENPANELSLQMSASDQNGGPPPSSAAPLFREPTTGETETVKREFGEKLLLELFGSGKDNGAQSLASLFFNKPELRNKYSAERFARSDLEGRRTLFRALVGDSHAEQDLPNAGTRAQNSLFSQALNLFILFKDHNHAALESLHWNAIAEAKSDSPAPPQRDEGGTRDLPSSFLQAHIFVGGERMPILTHVRGHYELGRKHFFQDSAVSAKHLLLNLNLGAWFIADAGSTYGTYFYDPIKNSWDAFRKDHWVPLHARDLLNIGNGYYRMTVLGGMVHFDPIQLPREIPPNRISRFTSITFDERPIRVELESTPHGETGGIQIGPFHFRYNRGRWSLLNDGHQGEVRLNGNPLRSAMDHQNGRIDSSKRAPIAHGDRLEFMGRTYQIRNGADGTSIHMDRVSSWASYGPPQHPATQVIAPEWSSSENPAIRGTTLNMNGAQILNIGRLSKKGTIGALSETKGVFQYSVADNFFLFSSLWLQVTKNAEHERLDVKNVGVKEGLFIQDGRGKNLLVPRGQSTCVKPGEKLVFKGLELIVFP